jgi:hypothetical protein
VKGDSGRSGLAFSLGPAAPLLPRRRRGARPRRFLKKEKAQEPLGHKPIPPNKKKARRSKNRLERLPSKSTSRERMKDSVRIDRELKKILKDPLKLPQKT